MSRSSSVGIIGAGRVGGALADALLKSGWRLDAVASRSKESAETLASKLPFVAAMEIEALIATSDLVMLAIPDDELERFADKILWREDQAVVHLSGSRNLEVLKSVTQRGALAGCMHPLQTFPTGEEPSRARLRFEGIACGIEAPKPLDGTLEAMVDDIGARGFRLEGVDRAMYHIASVFVSNNLVAAMAIATRIWSLAGLPPDDAQMALSPLLQSTAATVAERPLSEAITGPVARGDLETIRKHLESIESIPELARLYRGLANELLDLDLGHTEEMLETLQVLFNSPEG